MDETYYISELPQNWIICKLEDLSVGKNGIVDGPFGSNLKKSDYITDSVNGVPVLTTKNLEGDYSDKNVRFISKRKFEELKRSQVIPGDILVAKIGSIGKTGIYPKNARTAIIPANLLKFTVSKNADLKYVFWYLNFSLFQKKLKEISTATAQPAFNVTKFRQLTIPLPPLDEQHRIVAKIEELFSSLDKGIESLKAAQQQLKIYRQSVLKWAFEGRLTNNTQVGDLPEGWKCEPLGEIAELCLGKMLDKEKNRGEYQPYLRNINVRWGTFDLSSLDMMRFEDFEKERYSVQPGDLVICEGGEPGRCAIWTSNHTMYIQKALHRVRLVKNYHPKYIYYYMFFLASNGQLEQYFTGTTIKHLTGRELKRIKILAPKKYSEQEEIISQIESRLSICDKLEESINQNLQQSDVLRQSILKKAFEGELVT